MTAQHPDHGGTQSDEPSGTQSGEQRGESGGQELDVRPLRKPDKHPTIFATYDALAVGSSFVLVNDHDPRHLRDEFDRDHAGTHGWDYLSREPRDWRIRITKLAADPPREPHDSAGQALPDTALLPVIEPD